MRMTHRGRREKIAWRSLLDNDGPYLAVVIPCFNVAAHIEAVVQSLPPHVRTIICVDDGSADDSAIVIDRLGDDRIQLLRHSENRGLGAAMATGLRHALWLGADVIIKMDGDGQMNPAYLSALVMPLLLAEADYTKGNRFHDEAALRQMPPIRRFGNLGLSFLTKLASGYWKLFDPCNGYVAIRTDVLERLPIDRLANDYFFETSMLVELGIARAKVIDVPMPAQYGDEKSSLRVGRILRRFPLALARSTFRSVWRRHFVLDFGPPALFLAMGMLLMAWGLGFGCVEWIGSLFGPTPATAGTVMLAAMPFLMGFQLLLQFVVSEINGAPTVPLCAGRMLVEEQRQSSVTTDQRVVA
jgi:dolichol-phosphate mannosyltransferase